MNFSSLFTVVSLWPPLALCAPPMICKPTLSLPSAWNAPVRCVCATKQTLKSAHRANIANQPASAIMFRIASGAHVAMSCCVSSHQTMPMALVSRALRMAHMRYPIPMQLLSSYKIMSTPNCDIHTLPLCYPPGDNCWPMTCMKWVSCPRVQSVVMKMPMWKIQRSCSIVMCVAAPIARSTNALRPATMQRCATDVSAG